MLLTLFLLALFQQQPAASPAAASRIAQVLVEPAEIAIEVGDTIRLKATARDSAGRPINDLTVRWFQSGGHFEGRVDSTGLVTGGSTGTLTISALVAADAVLVPMQCEFFALEGLSQLLQTIEQIRTTLNPRLSIQTGQPEYLGLLRLMRFRNSSSRLRGDTSPSKMAATSPGL